MSRQRFKLVVGSSKRQSGEPRNVGSHLDIKAFRGVQASADGRSAQCEFRQVVQRTLNGGDPMIQLTDVT